MDNMGFEKYFFKALILVFHPEHQKYHYITKLCKYVENLHMFLVTFFFIILRHVLLLLLFSEEHMNSNAKTASL